MTAVAVDPHGRWALTTGTDGNIRVWDTTTWECPHTLTGQIDGVWAAAVDPHGRWALTTGDDGTVRVWDTTSWECLHTLTGHTSWVLAAAVDPHGRWALTTGTDGTVRVWDTTTWAAEVVLATRQGSEASWAPAGPRLLHASDGAWLWLRVQVCDADGSFLRSEPYELHFPTGGEAHRPLSA